MDTSITRQNSMTQSQLFSMKTGIAPKRPPKTLPTPLHDASGRLQQLPSCARLVAASAGRQRHLLEPAAASAAAPAAARLLLQTAAGDARTGACAAATGCSGSHSGGGACAHAAAIAPAAPTALAAAKVGRAARARGLDLVLTVIPQLGSSAANGDDEAVRALARDGGDAGGDRSLARAQEHRLGALPEHRQVEMRCRSCHRCWRPWRRRWHELAVHAARRACCRRGQVGWHVQMACLRLCGV
jgi:hypothetical protein